MVPLSWKEHGVFCISICMMVVVNISITTWCTVKQSSHLGAPYLNQAELDYTYIGHDHPLELPVPALDAVSLQFSETLHFSLNRTDPSADAEWSTLLRYPEGAGRVRLGIDHRSFLVTFYHQYHCLRRIQLALLDRADIDANSHHIRHCLNYLRQTFLCEAADSLEAGDFMQRDIESDRQGDTLICRDWEVVHQVMDKNFEDWKLLAAEVVN